MLSAVANKKPERKWKCSLWRFACLGKATFWTPGSIGGLRLCVYVMSLWRRSNLHLQFCGIWRLNMWLNLFSWNEREGWKTKVREKWLRIEFQRDLPSVILGHKLSLLSCPWPQWLSLDMAADASILCDNAAVLRNCVEPALLHCGLQPLRGDNDGA